MIPHRRKARELALQLLFQKEFIQSNSLDAPLKYFTDKLKLHEKVYQYAQLLLHGVLEHEKRLNEVIQKAAVDWRLERMALVDANILRIATFELLYRKDEVDAKTVINEAIENGKKYGGERSSSFINALLDQVYKENLDR